MADSPTLSEETKKDKKTGLKTGLNRFFTITEVSGKTGIPVSLIKKILGQGTIPAQFLCRHRRRILINKKGIALLDQIVQPPEGYGLTPKTLAEKLGISLQAVSKRNAWLEFHRQAQRHLYRWIYKEGAIELLKTGKKRKTFRRPEAAIRKRLQSLLDRGVSPAQIIQELKGMENE